jgi:Arc/MetJ family transcription regulator
MKTVTALDSELVEAAAKVLGTTKKDTVHAAISWAVGLVAQRNAQAQPHPVQTNQEDQRDTPSPVTPTPPATTEPAE